MAEIIFRTEPGPFQAEYPTWYVTRQPEGCTDPMVVRFVKLGKNGKLLDQTARWTSHGWDPSRWAPRVPKWLIKRVEAHMREVQP